MTTEERNAKMEALGIQAGSPAAKRFIADNETNEEAIERCAEELIASGQRVVPPSKPSNEQKTPTTSSNERLLSSNERLLSDNERLLIESIKQTKHLENISNILTFFVILALISTLVSLLSIAFIN